MEHMQDYMSSPRVTKCPTCGYNAWNGFQCQSCLKHGPENVGHVPGHDCDICRREKEQGKES